MNNMYERSSVEEDGFSEVLLLQIMEQFRNVVETVTEWIARGVATGPVTSRPEAQELPRMKTRPENMKENRTGRPVFDRRTARDQEGKVRHEI